ncbi:hypothetical protein Y032_0356g3351 [Ancylostoma ceylanicum]|uniref:Uncharacterized protein n=1 Tax=Ancylostoma ceylanicum TaxID=53326 RepID=A0A016RW79_9BILA|nr:hypothetical protein Y032_0356g3351 [Ancylostoma ceylanicum]
MCIAVVVLINQSIRYKRVLVAGDDIELFCAVSLRGEASRVSIYRSLFADYELSVWEWYSKYNTPSHWLPQIFQSTI